MGHTLTVQLSYRQKGVLGIIPISGAMRVKELPYGNYELSEQVVKYMKAFVNISVKVFFLKESYLYHTI